MQNRKKDKDVFKNLGYNTNKDELLTGIFRNPVSGHIILTKDMLCNL